MLDAAALGTFALASTALIGVPGPNLIYIITRSAAQGTRAGLASAAGVETATMIYVVASVLGISALVAQSEPAFATLRYAGAACLVYLAARTLREPLEILAAADPSTQPLAAIYRDGIIVNLLNPKVALFFLAFLPQFLVLDASPTSARNQLLLLGSVFLALALALDIDNNVDVSAVVADGKAAACPESFRAMIVRHPWTAVTLADVGLTYSLTAWIESSTDSKPGRGGSPA